MINNNEMFTVWIAMLMERNSVSEIKELTSEMITVAIEDARVAIKNEETWALGSSTPIEASTHNNNVETLREYIGYLEALSSPKHELELILGIYEDPNELPQRIIFCVPEEVTMTDLRKAVVTARDKAQAFTVDCTETAFESVLNDVCAGFGQNSYWHRAKLESLQEKEDLWEM